MNVDVFGVSTLLYVLVPAAFLMGSVPFGILFTRGSGIDLRSTGSRNIGATNVLRTAGKGAAVMTLLGDMIKGAVPVLIGNYLIINRGINAGTAESAVVLKDFWPGIIGLSAVLGHMFSIFLSFKGGKGVATGFGVLLAYSPGVAGIMLAVWLSVAIIFRYSSLAAVCAVIAMPAVFALSGASSVKVTIGAILALLIIFKHKSNIKNLLSGRESRIGKKADR